jgi:hypothetical protein
MRKENNWVPLNGMRSSTPIKLFLTPSRFASDDLTRLFPNAKVILTYRPFDSYYTSMQSTIFLFLSPSNLFFRALIATLSRLDTRAGGTVANGQKMSPFLGGNIPKEECREL